LDSIAVSWTESGTNWKLNASKRQLSRREGDLTFAVYLRSSRWNETGRPVVCSPEWRIESRRWKDWVKKNPSPDTRREIVLDVVPHSLFGDVRELNGPGLIWNEWRFAVPVRKHCMDPWLICEGT
jgi:hypothetical protein